ncbi:hypothetical protein MLD38_008531 [Melastoma candidum]|uniref:Uncharacterized protein n=1 Tax=Melastoma candidum TaxID=119954 RepID=A0ACB9RUT6_9MYRT|nr:hypothetical protein MLD38_008531 [Melastoma candidum]
MGNCQAIDAAALVIQHPDGRLERKYCPVPVSEVLKVYPGHYVSLIIPIRIEANGGEEDGKDEGNRRTVKSSTVRFTRVKLLRPTETLALGHAYRLVTSQEVLRAKKYGKMKQQQMQQQQQQQQDEVEVVAAREHGKAHQNHETAGGISDKGVRGHQRHAGQRTRQRAAEAVGMASGRRPSSWRPRLLSIEEGGGKQV